MALKVLSSSDIDQFLELGYVKLPQAFSPAVAAAVREYLWQVMGLNPAQPEEWDKPVIHLQKVYSEPPFDAAFTDRFWAGCDDVMGEGRYVHINILGWWPVSFPGFETGPWQPPETGWHVDGQQFHHHV